MWDGCEVDCRCQVPESASEVAAGATEQPRRPTRTTEIASRRIDGQGRVGGTWPRYGAIAGTQLWHWAPPPHVGETESRPSRRPAVRQLSSPAPRAFSPCKFSASFTNQKDL